MRLSWKTLVLALAFGMSASLAHAQTAVIGTEHVAWDQSAPDLATAQSYTYSFQIDGGTSVDAVGVVCNGPSIPFSCQADFPASTPGVHSMTLTASVVVSGLRITSLPSAPLTYRLVVAPAAPGNMHIVGN